MSDIPDLPLDGLCNLIENNELDPCEIVEAYLDNIETTDSVLNCYLAVAADRARARASASSRRHRDGAALGPLDGAPVALKDLIDVEGMVTTNGMAARRDTVAVADAEVVRRLEAAGAVILGKLNMHEAAMGATNDNVHFGRCHNPWAIGRTPGGSSGGSGAAVAGGLAAGALGSDNMGSIRIPSALCGVAGLKPTNDLVSTRGMVALSRTTGAVGPIARGVDGVALLMSVLAGPDADDPWSRAPPEALRFAMPEAPELTGLRIGVPELFFAPPDPEVAEAFDAALAVLAGLGAEIRPIGIEGLERSRMIGLLIIEAEAAVACAGYIDDPQVQFAPDIRRQLDYGRELSPARLVGAFQDRAVLQRRAQAIFDEIDVMLTPSTPCPAPAFEQAEPTRLASYMALANLCELPALSVPMGFTDAGLPLGMQIMAAAFRDPLTLRVGKAYEQATDWHLRRPTRIG